MEENVLSPSDYIKILKRRIWSLIIPFMMIVIIAGAVALLLPPVYKSTSTILIEQREIPAEYVTSSMTTFAEQRIQSINQRVLTSSRLLELINQFELYTDLKKKKTIDEIIAKMREDVILEPVNVEVADRKSGRTATATIAFTLSYEGKDAQKVQRVANTITSLFLKEDLKVRKDQASSTSEFLQSETERIREKVAEYEKLLAEFKQQNANSLPEVFQVNMQTLDNIQRNIDRTKENLRALKEKESELREQLANTPMDLESTLPQRDLKEDDERRLEALKMELINLKTKFSDLYPDVKKLKQEIVELTQKVEQSKKEKEAEKESKKDEAFKNPAYVTLSSRLAGIRSDVGSVKNNLKDLAKEATVYKARLVATPGVEEKYNALLTERNFLNAKHADLQGKMMEAHVAEELESKQKGERFSLVESARLPEKPYKPNRLAIILIGIVLGIGAGVGFASIVEFSDTSFRDGETLARATGFPVLTEVPNIITREDRTKRTIKRLVIFVTIAVIIVVSIFLFDTYVMDLDVLWAKIMRRIS
ncbi:MAG: chain-length determining protein [Deltaproteobacteria bacterium]|nr:MAG: chain-length determining protein [Deltaproteobacteria bacterium]